MLRIRLSSAWGGPAVLALPIGDGDGDAGPLPPAGPVPSRLAELATAFLADVEHTGAAGVVQALPRPLESPRRLLLVGVGAGDEAGWRTAGAALTRAAQKEDRLTVALAADAEPAALRGLAEGLLLAGYRFRLGADPAGGTPNLRQVTVLVSDPDRYAEALAESQVTAEMTYLARDLTNMPSQEKSPAWFAGRISRAAANRAGLTVKVREPDQLAVEGFGGILAVGGGSARGPRLIELAWRPRGAQHPRSAQSSRSAVGPRGAQDLRGAGRPAGTLGHVVLAGKGITFDTGGIDIKTREGMKLMRKDMGGAAAVMAATLGAAALNLPLRITAVVPLAENMISGSAFRPGDVIRQYGGQTSEITNTDAEGRLVLADALAYAARRLHPDLLVDLATLTGANAVALGKRTAALYSENDELAKHLEQAATEAGERVWRLPLHDDYLDLLGSDIADFANAAEGGAGSIAAALYLREFVGTARDRWAHIDMSAPSWADSGDAELTKGATGWGVRTLLRWLVHLSRP
ncbi:MAG: peptidase M17 [Actinobacteria bacterium 13_2_20CM_2_71_6]|nr:MAG: peptidase M17 [Actinobacteria bacterium 13_2_20CM_2_71_6]